MVRSLHDPTWEWLGVILVIVLGIGLIASVINPSTPAVEASAGQPITTRTIRIARETKSHVVLPEDGRTYADEVSSCSTVTVETLLP